MRFNSAFRVLRVPYFVICGLVVLLVLLAGSQSFAADPATAKEAIKTAAKAGGQLQKDAFYYNNLLGRGMNIGNAMEAPKEGDWGMKAAPEYFDAIKAAGFDSVRIPIRWEVHTKKDAPMEIEPEFIKRIDEIVDKCLAVGLTTIINDHHHGAMDSKPDAEQPRFLAFWKQIAEHFADRPENVIFELDNEPHDKLDDAHWNDSLAKALNVVRASNPRRAVIVGPTQWNQIGKLDALKLPEDDNLLIVTIHYYSPFEFTHQGAPWQAGADKWKGRKWTGEGKETTDIQKDFDKAAAWGKAHHRPIFLGEFGAFEAGEMESRARWTTAIVHEARARDFSTAYWEFGSGFGAYSQQKKEWHKPILDALMTK